MQDDLIYAYVADVHIGNHKAFGGPHVDGMNARACLAVETFRRAIKVAQDRNAVSLFVCGDLFDVASPTVGTLCTVASVIQRSKIGIGILPGNHDRVGSGHSNPANLMALAGASTEAIGHTFLEYTPHAEEILQQVDAAPDDTVFVAHIGIESAETPPWLRGKGVHVDALMKVLRGRTFFSGDWHTPRLWETEAGRVVQVGALCPTGFDNLGADYGRVWFLNRATNELSYEIVDGPRFFYTTDASKAKKLSEKSNTFVRLLTDDKAHDAVACSNVETIKPPKPVPERDTYRGDSISAAVETWVRQTYDANIADRVLAEARRLGA